MIERMGTFRTAMVIENAERRGETAAVSDALVDTGSEYTWVPRSLLEDLGIRPEVSKRFIVADGREFERDLGVAIVHAAGTFAPDFVVFGEPGDMIILGGRSLEGLNMKVDPHRKQLVSSGPVLAGAA